MILAELKKFVESRRRVSLSEAAMHFDIEPEAMRGMLEFWVAKGKISKSVDRASCDGGCACSFSSDQEIYLWNPQIGQISIEFR